MSGHKKSQSADFVRPFDVRYSLTSHGTQVAENEGLKKSQSADFVRPFDVRYSLTSHGTQVAENEGS